ncbi:MAG: hypothetical protein AAF376_16450 [Pseudomonadota bacterium]
MAQAQWFMGGTLHDATAGQWVQASADNRLATAGDWTARLIGSDRAMQLGPDGVRPLAQQLETCITRSAPQSSSNARADEIAAACATAIGMR